MDETMKLIPVIVIAGIAVYLLFKVVKMRERAEADVSIILALALSNETLNKEFKDLLNSNQYQARQIEYLRKALDEFLDPEAEVQES